MKTEHDNEIARPARNLSGELHAFREDEKQTVAVLAERARVLAQPADLAELSTRDGQHIVCFRAGESTYGVELPQLREIRPIDHLAVVPNTARFVLGLVQVHGDVTPVIDLVEFFGFHRAQPLKSPVVVLVVEVSGRPLGIACDELLDVEPVRGRDVLPVPAAVNATEREVVRGVTRRRILILDAEVLVGHPRLGQG